MLREFELYSTRRRHVGVLAFVSAMCFRDRGTERLAVRRAPVRLGGSLALPRSRDFVWRGDADILEHVVLNAGRLSRCRDRAPNRVETCGQEDGGDPSGARDPRRTANGNLRSGGTAATLRVPETGAEREAGIALVTLVTRATRLSWSGFAGDVEPRVDVG